MRIGLMAAALLLAPGCDNGLQDDDADATSQDAVPETSQPTDNGIKPFQPVTLIDEDTSMDMKVVTAEGGGFYAVLCLGTQSAKLTQTVDECTGFLELAVVRFRIFADDTSVARVWSVQSQRHVTVDRGTKVTEDGAVDQWEVPVDGTSIGGTVDIIGGSGKWTFDFRFDGKGSIYEFTVEKARRVE